MTSLHGSKDTPTETLDKDSQPVEGAPEHPGLTPEVTTDKGDSAEGQPGDTVPIKDENDQPIGPGTKITEQPGNDTGITIVDTPDGPQAVIPGDKEPGTYEVPVVIETPVNPDDPNGPTIKEETTITVTVPEPAPVAPEETQAEQHSPSYPDVGGKSGTTIEIPNTGDKLPEGTTFEVTGPEGYVIEVVPGTDTEDPKIKVTIPEDSTPGDKVELEIVVTYPDGSKDTPTETLDKDGQPVEGAPENSGLTPEVTTDKGDSAEGQPGDTVPIKDENDQPIGPGTQITEQPGNDTGITIVDTPEGPQAVIPEDKEPGSYEVPVVIETPVNPDDPNGPTIKEETTITVTVPEPAPVAPEETQAEQHSPSYPDVAGKPGTTIEIPNTGDKLPEGTTVEVTGPEGYVIEVVPGTDTEDPKIKVTIPEDSTPGDKVELEIIVTYPDGSKDIPTETLDKDGQPVEGAPENPGLTPEVTTDKGDSAEGQPGDTVPIKDENDQPIGPGTQITEQPGNDTGITIVDTPEGPQAVIPEDKEPGTYEIPVVIETPVNPDDPNGPTIKEETTITVTVPEPAPVAPEETQAEQHSPSYPDVSGKPGTTIEIPNTGDKLPEGTTVEVTGPEGYVIEVVPGTDTEDPKIKVIIPEDSNPGDKVELEIVVTYPDGSKDTPTETLDKDGQPVEGAPENPGLTPEVTTDKGDSAEGKPGDTVPIKDETDQPIGPGTQITEQPGNDTGITIVDTPEGPQTVIPEDKEPGSYEVPVVIETPVNPDDPNGPTIKEETTITVTVPEPAPVAPEETQAEQHSPSYPDVAGKPGSTVTVDKPIFKDKDGNEVTPPTGTTYRQGDDTPGITVHEDGSVSIDIPADAKPGDKIEVPIIVEYPDGSVDTPVVTITVGEFDKDIYEPEYKPGTGQPGTTVTVDKPIFKDKDGNVVTPPTGTTFRQGDDTPGITVHEDGSVSVDIPAEAKPGDKIEVSIIVEYPDGSIDTAIVTITVAEPAKVAPSDPAITDTPGKPAAKVEKAKAPVKKEAPSSPEAKKLPKTGVNTGGLAGLAAVSVLSGLGLVSGNKKKRDEDEA